MQDLPGAGAAAEGHGGMVSVFHGVDDGRQPGSTRPRRGDEMSVMPEWFQEQEQEEREEREAKRRANLDEWRRIAKMLRDLEYIKVPVKGECFQRIRQRHPHRTGGGKAMTELQPCPICKSTRICIDGGDNTYYPRCLDCGCTAPHDAWQTTRTPDPAEVERLVDDLLEAECQRTVAVCECKWGDAEGYANAANDLKSRLLAALTNATPYLSRDVKVSVDLLKDAAHRLAMYVLQSEAYQKDMDTRDAVDGVLALVMPRKAGE